MSKSSLARSGYAMLLVVLFVLLFLAMLGVTYRELGSALRIESTRVQQVQRDQGCVPAAARGLALLETGLPPSNPYVGAVTLTTPTGPQSFTVTFTSEGGNNWAVNATPTPAGSNPPPLPSTLAVSP